MSNPLSFFANPIPARGFNNFSATPVFECSPKAPSEGPKTVSITFVWIDYINAAGSAAPIAPISINLAGGSTGSAISQIRSIKIDNLGCPSPLTLLFPDTGDEVVCPGYSTIRSNVLTGGFQCIAFMPLGTGNIGCQSAIFFNNFQCDPVDLAEIQATQNRELSTGSPFSINSLGTRTRGDKWDHLTLNLALTGAASQVPLFGGPPDGYNFASLSEIHFRTLGNYVAAASPLLMTAKIINDIGQIFQTWSWYARNDLADFTGKEFMTVIETNNAYSSYVAHNTYRKYFVQNDVAGIGTAYLDLVYSDINVVNF